MLRINDVVLRTNTMLRIDFSPLLCYNTQRGGDDMKKVTKYIYPFVFSVCFFVTYILLGIAISIFLPSGDYAGLGWLFIALIIWIAFITPVYCYKYCKSIYKEKYRYLFVIYNSLFVAFCHTGPFLISAMPSGDAGVIFQITIGLFVWVAVCTYVSLLLWLDYSEKWDGNNSNETKKAE